MKKIQLFICIIIIIILVFLLLNYKDDLYSPYYYNDIIKYQNINKNKSNSKNYYNNNSNNNSDYNFDNNMLLKHKLQKHNILIYNKYKCNICNYKYCPEYNGSYCQCTNNIKQ